MLRSTRFALACLCTFASVTTFARPAPAGSAAERAVSQLQQRYAVPGAQFAAAVNGTIVDSASFGDADVATHAKVTDRSLFALASGSKPFTAMAIFTLIDKHAIALTTKAFPYLGLRGPDKRLSSVTIAQLLNHSGGLDDNIRVTTADPLDIAKAAAAKALHFTPGTKQVYSNTGFNVLGAIVAKASGQTYQAYVMQRVFAPAGVTDAVALDLAKPIPGQVVRYDKNGKPVVNTIPLSGTPAGGWVMSATDIVRVLVALDSGRIISAASRDAMLGPLPKPLHARANGAYYGGGWDVVARTPAGTVYGKNGGTTGAYSWMEHDAKGAVFAELYNGGTSGQDAQWSTAKPIERALTRLGSQR